MSEHAGELAGDRVRSEMRNERGRAADADANQREQDRCRQRHVRRQPLHEADENEQAGDEEQRDVEIHREARASNGTALSAGGCGADAVQRPIWRLTARFCRFP